MRSTTTPTERHSRYWNASAWPADRLSTAPMLHTTPDPMASREAMTGRR